MYVTNLIADEFPYVDADFPIGDVVHGRVFHSNVKRQDHRDPVPGAV
jgi:hypothetical protein